FTGTSFVATFAAGEATTTLTIPITDDQVAEPDETIVLTLSEPSVGTVGTQATATVTITDSGEPTAPAEAPVASGAVIGTGLGASGLVEVLNADGTARLAFLPYGQDMLMGVKVAVGDVNGDGVDDIITAPGMFSSHVKVFDGATGAELQSFLAFDASFLGGISIASGDVNGDGKADIVVGTALGSSHVKVFDGANGAEMVSFYTSAGSVAGVNVALGDVNGDGRLDLVTGAATGLSYVKAFNLSNGQVLQDFVAYRGFAGGVTVATADLDQDGAADIITGTATGSSHVKVFSGRSGTLVRSYLAFAPAFGGGVNVGARDVNGDGIPDVLVSGASGTDHTKFYDGVSGNQFNSFLAFGVGFTGGVFIG
ncbi:MAG TPA: VCBS repeat-containing protein, partial [Gemmata sp.]